MKINEIANMPYKLELQPEVQFGYDKHDGGSKYKDGASAKFTTDAGEQYDISAVMNARSQKQKDASREWRDKMDKSNKPFIRIPSSRRKGGIWEIAFTRVEQDVEDIDDDGTRTVHARPVGAEHSGDDSVSGTGDAFRVFATVMEFIEWLVRNKQPEYISIKSKDVESRKSLYARMTRKYAARLGYEVTKIVATPDGQRINLKQTKVLDRKLDPSEY